METLRITATLQSGQVSTYDFRLTLDGLLSRVWFQEHHPELLEYGTEGEWPVAELPFERRRPRHDPDAWYWAVSLGQFKVATEYMHHWHRRFDAELERYIDTTGRRSGRVNTKSGSLRAHRRPIPIIVTPEIVWYAVGNADEIRRMVGKIPAIGKKRSQGYGMISEWSVEPWPHDWSERGPLGRIMRDLPARADVAEGQWGIRPPYWVQENIYPVVVWDGPAPGHESLGDVSAAR